MTIEITLTEEQTALLNELAEMEGYNQSEMVAKALQFWLANL